MFSLYKIYHLELLLCSCSSLYYDLKIPIPIRLDLEEKWYGKFFLFSLQLKWLRILPLPKKVLVTQRLINAH